METFSESAGDDVPPGVVPPQAIAIDAVKQTVAVNANSLIKREVNDLFIKFPP
jgi:hypothetical protein